jgi:hypothetical protein
MKRCVVLLLAVLSCVLVAQAYQRAFYGGTFTAADGVYSPTFGVYDRVNQGWRRVPPPNMNGQLWDASPAGDNGLFVVGTFSTINNGVPSWGVAFFDGHKWCPIRQGLATSGNPNNVGASGQGQAVYCNSASSCYVAGFFSFIENLPANAPNDPQNFAHYIFDNQSNEWVFDTSIYSWNDGSYPPLPANINPAVPGTLYAVPVDNPVYFFVALGNSRDSYGNSINAIWRGGAQDGGWNTFVSMTVPLGIFPGASLLTGFDIDVNSSSPAIYVTSNSGTASAFAAKTTNLLSPCLKNSACTSPTQANDWVHLIQTTGGTGKVNRVYDVVVVNETFRYYAGQYQPGGGFNSRNVVLQQTGFSYLTPVGSPFELNTGTTLVYVTLDGDNNPVVVGDFQTANLYYPPETSDGSGVDPDDVRPLDTIRYVSVFRNGAWQDYFGGGVYQPGNPTVFAQEVTIVSNGNLIFVVHENLQFVYNERAEGLAFFDDSPSLNGKNIYPLFTSALFSRRDASYYQGPFVYDIACETGDCENIYVGGAFHYHGLDRLGSVARVAVSRDSPVVQSVGGGLWEVDVGQTTSVDVNLQLTAGLVQTLEVNGGNLYAGGLFGRGGNDFVCLRNLASISLNDPQNGTWQDVGGGCDDYVLDMKFWGDSLFVAGGFVECGGNVVNYVAAYTNGQYQPLNNGLDNWAIALEYFQGRMIVGGWFSYAGGLPVGGVAAWDGQKWRALEAACTDSCNPGGLTDYITVPQPIPAYVYSLHGSPDGVTLHALIQYRQGSYPTYLASWQYFGLGDAGQWTIMGKQINFGNDPWDFGAFVLKNNGSQVIVGASPAFGSKAVDQWTAVGTCTQAYSTTVNNWVDNNVLIGYPYDVINVVRSSAGCLVSPLRLVLSLFF